MMISKKLSRVTLVVAAAMAFYSCDRQERVPEPQSAELKKLENPYTVANMREAWQNIKPELDATKQTNSLGSGFDIGTTHLYVKFKPKNEQELDMLDADTTIYLYSYPLDVEIPEGLTNYRDPEVPDGQPTYQYASVPYNYNFPDVEHEVLEELFLPDQLDQVSSLYLPMDPCLELQLTNEAMRITDNTDLMVYPEEPCGGSGGGGSPVGCSYCPQGRIRLQDDVLGLVGLRGVKVRARRWFTTKEAYTDAEGKFVIWHDFDRPKNYSIVWERDDFDIRDGSFGQAIYNGPQTSGYWNLDISSGASRMYAIVHQAAYNYYYGNRLGLKSPPKNSFWASAVKISVHEESNSDDKLGVHCKDCRFLGIASRLKIWDSSRTTDQLYATTIHELAHASHWELRQNNWNDNNTDDIVKESWARGIQRELTRLRYPNYEPPYFGIYTGIVRDLIDGRDGYDQVEGYTILQVENVLKNTSSFEDWENNIRNNYNNPTENGLTAVFDFWN